MKLEAGKYYKTRDGRKAGPIKNYVGDFEGPVEGDIPKKGNRVWEACGAHSFGETNIDLVEEWTTVDIKMDGKYAYRKDPFTQVRILCVDRKFPEFPIVSLDEVTGTLHYHSPKGTFSQNSTETPHDLVPLQEKLPDLWGILYPDGSIYPLTTKEQAEDWFKVSPLAVKIIHYIPVPDQTA